MWSSGDPRWMNSFEGRLFLARMCNYLQMQAWSLSDCTQSRASIIENWRFAAIISSQGAPATCKAYFASKQYTASRDIWKSYRKSISLQLNEGFGLGDAKLAPQQSARVNKDLMAFKGTYSSPRSHTPKERGMTTLRYQETRRHPFEWLSIPSNRWFDQNPTTMRGTSRNGGEMIFPAGEITWRYSICSFDTIPTDSITQHSPNLYP